MVLITGRQLEHWHTGSMTRRSGVLDALEPAPPPRLNGDDLARLGLQARRHDPRGLPARRGDAGTARRTTARRRARCSCPFAYVEAAANLLTNAALDPFGKIPEFKYCAVRVAQA
jgi:formate dehydrogenase major subunit